MPCQLWKMASLRILNRGGGGGGGGPEKCICQLIRYKANVEQNCSWCNNCMTSLYHVMLLMNV
ncbi:hypothetical protein RchiOBHm_Chr2g0171551 [Rosa chinensis]|uniref:Uncharacterized protein n=1 Tax=Rosa chinensis TaxID=74649 RepID=A0A2P6S5E1_ROSCH|nr:hypothetical protein RchiOBHm_Chr2g0171551 [Rosa chinensis]